MPYQKKILFDQLPWETPMEGVRQKAITQGGYRLRLVEYAQAMPAHWCDKGHYGYLLAGSLELEYTDETVVYKAGDGIFIPDGPLYKHRGKVLSQTALVFFTEPMP